MIDLAVIMKIDGFYDELDKLIKKGFKYITRAKHGELVVHKKKPTRQSNYWHSDYRRRPLPHESSFSFVTWVDDPVYLPTLYRKMRK